MYLDTYKDQIIQLCEKHKVRHLFAFGSVLTNKFSEKSDIDLVVDIKSKDPIKYAENYFDLKFQLEDLLERKIDLLEERGIKNLYLKENIDSSKLLIYGA
jgi:predicted nucleotidyltransferase